jgi:mannose-6-phosphate isomerase-like protein (cupin superfamily)
MKLVSLADLPEEGVSHNPEIRKRVILRRGLIPHLTNFTRSVLLPAQTATAHTHPDMYEIFLVQSGTALVKINDTTHTIAPGDCLTIEPGEPHEITNPGPAELVLLYFGIEV